MSDRPHRRRAAIQPRRSRSGFLALAPSLRRGCCLLLALLTAISQPVESSSDSHRAALVAEVASAQVLHATGANRRLAPASLSKLMTAYLILEALERSDLERGTLWTVSARAAAQPSARFGLRKGERVDVATVLAALVVASANDAALVAAEAMAGSEEQFVMRMNAAAGALGMQGTRFANASGLPAQNQYTTARDMGVLARALWLRFPGEAGLFSRLEVEFKGRRQSTINNFLTRYRGANGMKTGFTCRAGYNLVASVERGGRRLVGVVLGAPTPEQRDRVMQRLMDRALEPSGPNEPLGTLDSLSRRTDQGQDLPLDTSVVAHSCAAPTIRESAPSGWSIDVGVERDRAAARRSASRFIREWKSSLRGGRVLVIPRTSSVRVYRAVVTGLAWDRAMNTCLAYRRAGGSCVVMDTPVARAQLDHGRQVEQQTRSLTTEGARKQ